MSIIYNCFNAEAHNAYSMRVKGHQRLPGEDGESFTEALEMKLKEEVEIL